MVARRPAVITELHRKQTADLALGCIALNRVRRFERLGRVQTNTHFIGMQHIDMFDDMRNSNWTQDEGAEWQPAVPGSTTHTARILENTFVITSDSQGNVQEITAAVDSSCYNSGWNGERREEGGGRQWAGVFQTPSSFNLSRDCG